MKIKLITLALFFVFGTTLIAQTTDGKIYVTPQEWQILVDSLEDQKLKLYKMDLLTSDTTGGRFRTIELEQPPFVDLQRRKIYGLQQTETMVKSEENWTQRWVPVIEDSEKPQEVSLQQVWQRTNISTQYTYLVDQQYYVWNVIASHYFEWEKPPTVELRSVSCPAPDPLITVVFTGTNNGEAEMAYNTIFKPLYEAGHGVTLEDISLSGADPLTVFQSGVESLSNSLYGAGSGVIVPEVDEISDVAYCHSECQQTFMEYGHTCNGYGIFDRFIQLVGPLGLCWTPGGPIEVTGSGGSTDPFILSLQIYMNMVTNDAVAGWVHFQDLSACSYASGMGVGFYAGTSGTVTCNWINITGAPPCASSPISCSVVLPLELTYFGFMSSTYDEDCGNIELGWGAASSANTQFVSIERSTDGASYEEIGTEYIFGDFYGLRHFTFTDVNVPDNDIIYYRLKMVDWDGSVKYSDVIAKHREDCTSSAFSAYPNPFSDHLVVSGLDVGDSYEVLDVIGRSVHTEVYAGGEVYLNLQPGVYFLQKNRTLETIKVIKN